MSELTRIEIRNFQSHRHTVIEPAPAGGLTVIVGPSDSGKTAILRALRWIFYNQPQGDAFKRVGSDFVEVEIETADGHVIERQRTASTNRYAIDHHVFEGFGTSVPLEVQQITGVFPIRLGDQEIIANLAGQLEAPFLGSSISGLARAKALGKLAGIEVIDRAMRDLAGDVQRTRLEKSRLEAELGPLDAEIARYAHLPALAARIEQLKAISARIEAAYERWKALSEVRQSLQAIADQIEAAESRLASLGDVDRAHKAVEQAHSALERRARLRDVWRDLDHATNSLRAAESALTRLQGVDRAAELVGSAERAIARRDALRTARTGLTAARLSEKVAQKRIQRADRFLGFEPRLNDVAGKIERRATLIQIHRELATHTSTGASARQRIDAAQEQLSEATRAYAAALIESGSCPTCGQAVDDSVHTHIKEVLAS